MPDISPKKTGRPSAPRTHGWCMKCDRLVEIKEFYLNYNPHHTNNKMFYCKNCCREIGIEIIKNAYNFEVGIRNLCSFFDMPFVYSAFNILKEKEENSTSKRDFTYVYQYMECLKECEIDNSAWENLSGNQLIIGKLLTSVKATSDDLQLLNELEIDWGKQDTLEDYLFLVEKFTTYTDGEKGLPPNMINTMRYLCLAELEVKKIRETKDYVKKDLRDAENKVMGYYKALKLDNVTLSKSKSLGEKMIENWIYIEENYDPLEYEPIMFKDRCNFNKDNQEIMRCIGNVAVGSKDYPNLDISDIESGGNLQ